MSVKGKLSTNRIQFQRSPKETYLFQIPNILASMDVNGEKYYCFKIDKI